MRLVVDTNQIIAALIKDSYARNLISNSNFKLFTPDFSLEEIYKYKSEICKKAGVKEEIFDILINLIFDNIEIVPSLDYKKFQDEIKKLIPDIKDIPFLACAIAIKADGIWSDDKHFLKQDKIKTFATKDLIKYLG